MNTIQQIEQIVANDDAVTLNFSRSIKGGGYRIATLMVKGRGDWVRGHGPTVADALADLISKMPNGLQTRPVVVETPTVTVMTMRAPG